MPQVSAAVLRSKPSSTSASASIRRAAALFFYPLAALRSSEAVRSSRVIDTAAPIDAAPLKSQHRVRVSLIRESPMSHSLGPLVLGAKCNSCLGISGLSIRSRCLAGNRWSRSVTPPRTSPNCPKAEHDADEWQAAMEALLLVAELGGPPLFARIMRASNRHVERVFNASRKDK